MRGEAWTGGVLVLLGLALFVGGLEMLHAVPVLGGAAMLVGAALVIGGVFDIRRSLRW